MEEVNTKQRLGCKINEDSDRTIKVTGGESSAISGMGYSRQFYGVAWSILERKFGRPHVIIDAQLESIRKANQVKPQDATDLISFSVVFSIFSNVLKEYEQIGDLHSSSTLSMIVDKIPQVIKEKWWFYIDDKDEDWPDLIMFEKWLSRTAFLHEGFSASKGERREEDQRGTNREKRFSSVLVRLWKKPSKCKVTTARKLMALNFKLIFNKNQNNKKRSANQNKWILLKFLR